jgi:hypothetical protein
MKLSVVPAQITTVEDKIAGNLTFIQIFLLIIPLLTSTVVFVEVSPHMKISMVKTMLIGLQFLMFGSLALRVRGKVVLDWLIVFLRFSMRPRIYIFTKNDLTHRNIPIGVVEEEISLATPTEEVELLPALSLIEQVSLSKLMEDPSLTIGFTLAEKGGMHVSLTKQT